MHAKSMPAWRYYELFMKRLPELQFVGMHVLSKHLGIGEVCPSTLSSDPGLADLAGLCAGRTCPQEDEEHRAHREAPLAQGEERPARSVCFCQFARLHPPFIGVCT